MDKKQLIKTIITVAPVFLVPLHNMDQKRELKRIAKEHDPAYIEKKGEKLEKENRKEADKMKKKLQKNIEKRHNEEEKKRQDNQKQRIQSMKKSNKHMEN